MTLFFGQLLGSCSSFTLSSLVATILKHPTFFELRSKLQDLFDTKPSQAARRNPPVSLQTFANMSTAPAAASTGQTAAPPGPSTDLTSLPIELLQEIAKHTGSDILSLRAVCHDIHDKVDDVFARVYFSTRVHLTTRHSLEALAEIVKVSRFRKVLKEVEFEIVSSWRIERNFYEYPLEPKMKILAELEVGKFVYQNWTTQELDSIDIEKSLAGIFLDLAQHKVVPVVTITLPMNRRHFTGFGSRWLVRNMFPGSDECPEKDVYVFKHCTHIIYERGRRLHEQKQAIAAVLETATASQLDLKSLILNGGADFRNTDPTGTGPLCDSPGVTQVFSNLRALTVDLSIVIAGDLLEILKSCQRLEEINMVLLGDLFLDDEVLQHVANALPWATTLKNVTIAHATFGSARDIIDFLRKHEKVLQKLVLSRISIEGRGGWQVLFAELSNFLQLAGIDIYMAMGDKVYWRPEEIMEHQEVRGSCINRAILCDRKNKLAAANYRICGMDAVKQELEELASTSPVFERCWEKPGADGSPEFVFDPLEEVLIE
ncbi:hypothetical protein CKM354_000253400 [Cercospora kikuchii]|uniref:F-box domain-containing protein n=1 Tax=Cercospora kikuchii TaxID=84275 RepID=A0A9P3CAA0_9PEZI|nr:uncharacterized protein CKM354_000253400 [Cercospora kikuchii]GIZ39143.1 hypothetical protein CKM354_000253400 [Cercospora kikuchii]